ncbi:MAG: nitroreductase family protein [Bacteroidota bacterium]
MDFKDLVLHRESTRKYNAEKPVEPEKIEQIMEACRMAPSACNSQPWKIIVADDKATSEALASATYGPLLRFNRFASQAPVVAAIVAEKPNWLSKVGGNVKDKDFYLMDIGIVAEHFCLQAADLGLGTCMIGWFDEARVKEILHVPPKKRVLLLITLGYPAKENNRKKIRKSPEAMWCRNRYK